MEIEEKRIWWKQQPYITAIIGVMAIIIASLIKLVIDWITIPLTVSTFKEFCDAVGYSFTYVLNFGVKAWWVFLFILYIQARWNK